MSNLLLVDDDDFVRSALSRALNRTGGFSVIPAEHGRRALELLATEHVDAILTDLQMPVMDGLTLLAELFDWPAPGANIFKKRGGGPARAREPLQHILMEAARLLDESARSGVAEARTVDTAPQPAFDAERILAEVLTIEGAIGAALVQAT